VCVVCVYVCVEAGGMLERVHKGSGEQVCMKV